MTLPQEDARLARAYQAGNDMPETALRAWLQLTGRYGATPAPSVLEIGAGTGMTCSAMASGLNPHLVIGVDSSAPMLAQAQRFTGRTVRSTVLGR